MKNLRPIFYRLFKNSTFLLLFLTSSVFSQTHRLDSLLTLLKTAKEDTSKVNLLSEVNRAYTIEANDNSKLKKYALEQIELSKKLNFKKGLAFGYMNLAIFYVSTADFKIALEYNQLAIKLMQEVGNKKGESSCYINMGQNYSNLGDYPNAIKCMLQGVKIKEEINDKRGVAVGYGNIGSIFFAQEKYDEALKYYLNSLKIKEEINDKMGMAMSFNNIGNLYLIQKKTNDALIYFNKSLEIKEKLGSKNGTVTTYSNIGDIYLEQNKLNTAYSYQLKALKIAKISDDKKGMLTAYKSMGAIFEKKKNYSKAIAYYKKMLDLANESNLKEGIMTGYKSLAEAYKKNNQYDSALTYINHFYSLKDTIFNKESFKQLAELNTRYETDKKEKEILLLTKDQQLNEKIIRQQQLVRWGLIGGLVLLLISIVSIFRRYRFKQKANLILEKQKEEIHQKNILITDSIDYAKTIQEAVFPTIQQVHNVLPESFVLYKPKAIVSGDFYWVNATNDQLVCAVADCTGHGVPGAFMSLLGYNMLENVAKKLPVATPAVLLDELNQEVVTRLSTDEDDVKHGMDISLIAIDRKNNTLQYAGAHNSLYVVRDNELIEVKANKLGIGSKKASQLFTNHTLELKKGDMIYLFTDGFPDQIGGPDRKKFYYPPFKTLLKSISTLDMDAQQHQLNQVHQQWISNRMEQTDDILIMGIRYN